MSAETAPIRVLMVCMGNICRSPTAEGVLRHKLQAAGLAGRVEVASAGTHDYHVGSPPDPRSQEHALLRGYDLSAQRARHFRSSDFACYDWVLVMDDGNHELVARSCPPQSAERLRLLMSFAPQAGSRIVPDPYYGGADGFERVLDLIEQACDGLIAHISTQIARDARDT